MAVDLEVRMMMTPKELAQLYPPRLRTWHRWLREGRVRGAVKVNRMWLIPVDVAKQLMAGVTPLDQLLHNQYAAAVKQHEEAAHGQR